MTVAENNTAKPAILDFRNSAPDSVGSPAVQASVERSRPGGLTLRQQKESAARRVASIITWTFALASMMLLIGTYRILRWQPTEAKTLLVDAGIPFLEKGGLFLSSTFGPLLAFVLGYYFGEKSDKGRSSD